MYETHGMTKAEEDKAHYGEGIGAKDVVRFLDVRTSICWADFTERLSDGRSWVHRCPREGDFSATVGMCPQHYEEVIGG